MTSGGGGTKDASYELHLLPVCPDTRRWRWRRWPPGDGAGYARVVRALKTQHVGIALLLVSLGLQLRTWGERGRLAMSTVLPMVLTVVLLAWLTGNLDTTGGRPMTTKVAVRMLGIGALVGGVTFARHRGWL